MLSTTKSVFADVASPAQHPIIDCSLTAVTAPDTIRQTLSKRGVVHLRNFFAQEEIRAIRSELNQLFDNFWQLPMNINPKTDSTAPNNIREIANLVKHCPTFEKSAVYQQCYELASTLFGKKCRYGFDHAISKSPGSAPVNWHQDQFYSNFDRDKQCISFWIPLQAVTPVNGGMEYALQATAQTRLLPHTRVTPDSYMYHVPAQRLSDLNTISPEMNAGDVCLHTPLTLHRSHPNNGIDTRSAWILQFNKFGPLRFGRWQNLRNQFARLVSEA